MIEALTKYVEEQGYKVQILEKMTLIRKDLPTGHYLYTIWHISRLELEYIRSIEPLLEVVHQHFTAIEEAEAALRDQS
ncbi:MAG TPA: hypothetical protein VHL10_06275 [Nitrososphaera sp.]|jgi:hypothetical protein|nr:hypothetical protein [Nitrososphaera sp.]